MNAFAKKKTIKLSTRVLIVPKSLDDSCFPKRSIQRSFIYHFLHIPFFLNSQHFFNPLRLTSKRRNKNLPYAFTGSGFTPARRMAGGVQGYLPVCASQGDRSFIDLAYMPANTCPPTSRTQSRRAGLPAHALTPIPFFNHALSIANNLFFP